MFVKDRVRRELALEFLKTYKEYFLSPGAPFNEQNMALAFRNAFMVADIFKKIEELKQEDLMAVGQPQRPQQWQPPTSSPGVVIPRPPAPNGAPSLQAIPPLPKAPGAA